MNTINTFDRPNAVRPVPFTDFQAQDEQVTLRLPSKSVVVLEIQ